MSLDLRFIDELNSLWLGEAMWRNKDLSNSLTQIVACCHGTKFTVWIDVNSPSVRFCYMLCASLGHNVLRCVLYASWGFSVLNVYYRSHMGFNVLKNKWHSALRSGFTDMSLDLKFISELNPLWLGEAVWRHRQKSMSTLTRVVACWLLVPSRCLNRYWLTIN